MGFSLQSGLANARPISSATKVFGFVPLEGGCGVLLAGAPLLEETRTADFSNFVLGL